MKKHLIALAALAAATSAMAQSSVTLYGNLDASIGRKQTLDVEVDGFGNLTGISKSGATKVDSSDLYESFFGMRGEEDLGGGLKSLFKLESAAFNPFGSSAVYSPSARLGLGKGQLGNLISQLQPGFDLPSTDGSWSNTVAYASPNLSGLTFAAQYSAKEAGKGSVATGNYNGGAYDLSVGYVAGPFAASLVYGEVRSTDATASAVKDKAWLAGASYDFGAVKAFAQYGRDKYTQRNEEGSVTPKLFQLGVSAPVGANGTVLASFGQTKVSVDDVSFKTRDLSLGYTHALSKRTSVYTAILSEKAKATVGDESGSKSIDR